MRENPIFGQIFPQGEKLPEEFSAYFIGQAYVRRWCATRR